MYITSESVHPSEKKKKMTHIQCRESVTVEKIMSQLLWSWNRKMGCMNCFFHRMSIQSQSDLISVFLITQNRIMNPLSCLISIQWSNDNIMLFQLFNQILKSSHVLNGDSSLFLLHWLHRLIYFDMNRFNPYGLTQFITQYFFKLSFYVFHCFFNFMMSLSI